MTEGYLIAMRRKEDLPENKMRIYSDGLFRQNDPRLSFYLATEADWLLAFVFRVKMSSRTHATGEAGAGIA